MKVTTVKLMEEIFIINRLIAVDLRKQKAVDAESRAVQQIVFNGKIKAKVADIRVIIYYILEQPKERII